MSTQVAGKILKNYSNPQPKNAAIIGSNRLHRNDSYSRCMTMTIEDFLCSAWRVPKFLKEEHAAFIKGYLEKNGYAPVKFEWEDSLFIK